MSSVLMISISRWGSTQPCTWWTSASGKSRTTWSIASTSRMREEFITQALALAGALDETRDVDELDGGGDDLFTIDGAAEEIETLVRDLYDTHVRLDGAEGEVFGGCRVCFGEGIEEGGFADVGESYDTDFHDFFYYKISLPIRAYLKSFMKRRFHCTICTIKLVSSFLRKQESLRNYLK